MKSISKPRKVKAKRPRPVKPETYRVMITATRVNTIKAVREDVAQTYDIPGNLVFDADHARREALRLCAREHPTWADVGSKILA